MIVRRIDSSTLPPALFTMFWVAQAVSLFGDRLHNFSLVALVNRFAENPGMTLPKIYLAMYLPIFTLAPLIGALIDRCSKRWVLVVTDLARGALVICIPLLFVHTGSFVPIMGIVFLLTTGNLFFSPAKSALIPELVPSDRLIRVNSILWSAGIVGMIGGFLGGGLIFDYVSWQSCFYLDGATYTFSAILLTGIAFRGRAAAASTAAATERRPSLMASIGEGLAAMRRSAAIMRSIGVQAIVFFGAGGFSVLAVVLIGEASPPGSSLGIGIAGLSIGLGMGIGSILANRIPAERRGLLERVLFVLLVPAAASFATGEGYVAITSGSFFAGLAAAPLVIVAESELQHRIGTRLRGIIFSFREILTRSLFVGSAFLFGILGNSIHNGVLLVILGLFLASIGVTWLVAMDDSRHTSTGTSGGPDGDH
ncbi:MAG TPA: MFS transporter [Patescibacteria group bacterium]|nr:MFS transporter [Patescibacteria group bacterium]